jgi:2-polyprenyl-3-methyl-5-hydroxy-6-metoxy-1,4-benzoquinol methylase
MQPGKSRTPFATTCLLCGSRKTEVWYFGPIRDGLIPSAVSGGIRICKNCTVQELEPDLRKTHNYYAKNEYRKHIPYDKNTGVRLIRERLSTLENTRLYKETILDIGAGNGLFLDIMKGFGAKTYFVEVNEQQEKELEKRHQRAREIKTATIVTLFDVIEHVEDPALLLKGAIKWMNDQSILIVGTPLTDVATLNPESYYRTQHTWYFNKQSLHSLAKTVGLECIDGRIKRRLWDDSSHLYMTFVFEH